MALTEVVEVESIEVLSDGTLIPREVTRVLRDGVELARSERRWALMPGDPLDGQPERIVAMAGALWTDEMISNRLALIASPQEQKP
jgi:hypothetical protein